MRQLNDSDFKFEQINGVDVVLRGVGKMFYQEGFPISMAVEAFNARGFKVSILHVADELLKHGWPEDTVIKRIREDFSDGTEQNVNMNQVELFCRSTYEDQRDMIFSSLFGSKENGVTWLDKKFEETNELLKGAKNT